MTTSTAALADELAPLVARINTLLRRQTTAEGVTLTQLRVLAALRDEGPLRVTELAAIEHVAQPTMTACVIRLDRLGWVQRVPDPTDNRAVHVRLADAGRSILAAASAARAAALAGLLDDLDGTDRQAIGAALPALTRLLEGRSRS